MLSKYVTARGSDTARRPWDPLSMKMPARSFRYVNEALAKSLASDLGLNSRASSSQEIRMGATLPVIAELKLGRATPAKSASDPQTLDRIVRGLWKTGQLRAARPEEPHEFWRSAHDGWYVGEHLIATPVTLPPERHPSASRELTVWVCSPEETTTIPENSWMRLGVLSS